MTSRIPPPSTKVIEADYHHRLRAFIDTGAGCRRDRRWRERFAPHQAANPLVDAMPAAEDENASICWQFAREVRAQLRGLRGGRERLAVESGIDPERLAKILNHGWLGSQGLTVIECACLAVALGVATEVRLVRDPKVYLRRRRQRERQLVGRRVRRGGRPAAPGVAKRASKEATRSRT